MAGQSNHFLITILVGLAAVDDGTARLPPEMRTSWDPRDRSRSAARSREFAIKALLAWLVDALDAYIRALQRPPRIANAATLRRIAEAETNDEGLAGRVRSIAIAAGRADSAEAILAEVATVWRNRLVHQTARNQLRRRLVNVAHDNSAQFADSYQGLIIDDLIKHVECRPSAAPTFKEVTAIVRAVHKLVEKTDEYLLHDLDLQSYLHEILQQYLTEGGDAKPASVMARASNVWGRSPDRRRSTIRQIALNNGFTAPCEGAPNELTIAAIEAFVNFSPSEAVRTLVNPAPAE
jgi:hypothetical protein